jgi:hypothetical protein
MLLSWIRYRRQPGSLTYDQQNLLLPGRVEAAPRIPPNSHCRRPLLVNGSVFRPAMEGAADSAGQILPPKHPDQNGGFLLSFGRALRWSISGVSRAYGLANVPNAGRVVQRKWPST